MSNRGNTKKRRVGGGGALVSADNVGGGLAELSAIKSMMQELVQQNRAQTNMINSMQGEITSMKGDMTQLKKKCNTMETTINSVIRMFRTVHDIKLTMNSRFDGVDEKLKYHDILLQNQHWEYSAPRPSRAEYWDIIGAAERSQAEDFLSLIQQCTEEMRYGSGDGNIEIEIDANLPYNEVFLPHWKEFANALEQYSFYLSHSVNKMDDSKLRLDDVDLPEDVINLLSQALKSTHFHRFVFTRNNLGQKGWDFALNYLKSNTILREFHLGENPISSIADIKRLCKIIEAYPSIEILTLSNCVGVDVNGHEMLQMIVNAGKRNVEVVELSDNQISTQGETYISDCLAENPFLKSLYLEGNQLNDQDAIGIANALENNTNLRFLDLTNNNITRQGWLALRKAEFDNTSLNTASDCNHSCNIKYPSDGSDAIEGLDVSEMNGDRKGENAFDPTYVRQKKIYSVLSSRNRDCSNVEHFGNIPVELLPNILYSIKEYSNYPDGGDNMNISQAVGHVNPLSIMYEICRHWDESLAAFEALSS